MEKLVFYFTDSARYVSVPSSFPPLRLCNPSHQIRIMASCGGIIQELKGMKAPLSREGLRGKVFVFILLSSLLLSSPSSSSSLHSSLHHQGLQLQFPRRPPDVAVGPWTWIIFNQPLIILNQSMCVSATGTSALRPSRAEPSDAPKRRRAASSSEATPPPAPEPR